jgi:hypothetical protein
MFSRNVAIFLGILIMLVLVVGETLALMAILGQGHEQPFGMILGGFIGWNTPRIIRILQKDT